MSRRSSAPPPRLPASLTSAELKILHFLPTHLSFREIAERTFVSANTVKTQANAVYRKLDVRSRSEAVALARELGLLDYELASTRVGQVDQRGLDAPADVLLVRQPELHEDRVDVLLDGALAQEQLLGDRLVALALGHQREDLELAPRQLVQRRARRRRLRAAISASTTLASTTEPPAATSKTAAIRCSRSRRRSLSR